MANIQIFTSPEFGDIRTVDQNGEPWFVGKDVAAALGYAKPENALAAHVDEQDKTTTLIQGDGSNYKSKTTVINESGLYSLIFGSKLEGAVRFKRWKPSTNTVMLIQQTNGQTSLFAAAAAQKNTTTAGKFVKEV